MFSRRKTWPPEFLKSINLGKRIDPMRRFAVREGGFAANNPSKLKKKPGKKWI